MDMVNLLLKTLSLFFLLFFFFALCLLFCFSHLKAACIHVCCVPFLFLFCLLGLTGVEGRDGGNKDTQCTAMLTLTSVSWLFYTIEK